MPTIGSSHFDRQASDRCDGSACTPRAPVERALQESHSPVTLPTVTDRLNGHCSENGYVLRRSEDERPHYERHCEHLRVHHGRVFPGPVLFEGLLIKTDTNVLLSLVNATEGFLVGLLVPTPGSSKATLQ